MNIKRRFKLLTFVVSTLLVLAIVFLQAEDSPQTAPESIKTIYFQDAQVGRLEKHFHVETGTQDEQDPEWLDENFQERLQDIADAYAEQAQYPMWSLPIQSAYQIDLAQPINPATIESRVFDEQGNMTGVTVVASTDKINYLLDETVKLSLTVNGARDNANISAEAIIKSSDGGHAAISFKKQLQTDQHTSNQLLAQFDGREFSNSAIVDSFIAIVSVKIDQFNHVTTVPFSIKSQSGLLENSGQAFVDQDHLKIPLEFNIDAAGYYFVTAVLADAASNKPLLKLKTEGRLSSGNESLVLRAHHQALKNTGSEGPYLLKILEAYRGSENGISGDVPTAISNGAVFDIPAFEFDLYSNNAYTDPFVEERIDFLRRLSGHEPSQDQTKI